MTIQIGDKTLATLRPADLDGALAAENGCNAVEAQTWLQGTPIAGFVARALHPFLQDEIGLADLAMMIDAAGTAEVASQVAALYGEVPLHLTESSA
jgi:hypothetical protein